MRGLEVAVRHPLLYGIDAWQHLGFTAVDFERHRVVVRYEGGPGHHVWLGSFAYLNDLPLLQVMRFAHVFMITLTGLLLYPLGRFVVGSPQAGIWALFLFSVADGALAFVLYPQTTGLLLYALFLVAVARVVPARRPLEAWPWSATALLAFLGLGQTHALSLGLAALSVLFLTLGGVLRPKRHPLLLVGVAALLALPFLRFQTQRFATGILSPFLASLGQVGFVLAAIAILVAAWFVMERARPILLRWLRSVTNALSPETSASAASLGISMMILAVGIAGGVSYLYPGKGSFNFLVDNLYKVVLGALSLGGFVLLLRSPDRTPGGVLFLWTLPMVAVFGLGVFITFRLDPMRYVLPALLPLAVLGATYVVRRLNPRQAALFALAVVALLPVTYSPLLHTPTGPGQTYQLASLESYEAATWIDDYAGRPSAVGSDIRLSSLIFGTVSGDLRPKGTYSYIPEIFTDASVEPGTELYQLMRRNSSGFDRIGVSYVFYDRDMLTYGASLYYYTSGRNFTTPLTPRELDKFQDQPIFNLVYDSGDAWIYYVNQRALP